MSNLINHALNEFKASGWTTEDGNFEDEVRQTVCKDVLALLEAFSNQMHSGFSAPYVIDLFSKLANFEPLGPLTGEDWEWVDVSEESGYPLYQNKRSSRVFKNADGAYDVNGIVFWEYYSDPNIGDGVPFKSFFTSKDSHTPVTFPYTPTTVYQEYKDA